MSTEIKERQRDAEIMKHMEEAKAERLAGALLERDDINILPIPAKSKAYNRRTGLKAMKRQPKQFQAANAEITNPGKKDHFQNYTTGEMTGGKKLSGAPVELSMNTGGVNVREDAEEVMNKLLAP